MDVEQKETNDIITIISAHTRWEGRGIDFINRKRLAVGGFGEAIEETWTRRGLGAQGTGDGGPRRPAKLPDRDRLRVGEKQEEGFAIDRLSPKERERGMEEVREGRDRLSRSSRPCSVA